VRGAEQRAQVSRMDDVSASLGYVPIGSLSAAVEGVGNRPPGAPSQRPQYFAALAGKVFRPTYKMVFGKSKLFFKAFGLHAFEC
jgi:hypothetical protein